MPSSPSPPIKRRRIEPSSALSKPFRSPLKIPLNPCPQSANTANAILSSDTPLNESKSGLAPEPLLNHITPATPLSRPSLPRTRLSSHISPSKSSPQVAELQKKHTALLAQLNASKVKLDTTAQALKLESSQSDAELELLIKKWRRASKDAAEEVFSSVRDRVNRMGGVKAWKERERERVSSGAFGGGWDTGEEKPLQTDEDEVDPEETEPRQAQKRVVDENDEDEGFTMDMMLKTLNIPLEVIGYDKDLHKWID
ncbi:MAG: hypothetical protein LQ342_000541 [Letrouitia transgressa]|nr:MAG: hypothetical protein LQ342_000541 [Letrouitia transgressa]